MRYYTAGMDGNLTPRIGNTERERAFELLKQHLSEGRIAIHEFDERAERVATATTQPEIDAIFADLPAPANNSRRFGWHPAWLAVGAACLILIAAIAIVALNRSTPQATRTVVITTAILPTASPVSSTTTTTTTTSQLSTTTTPTSPTSGTPVNLVQYLMDSKKLDSSTYLNFDTGPATVSGTTFTRSVMVDPEGRHLAFVEYDLGRKYTHLDGVLGVRDDATPSSVAMQFQIYADGVLVTDTPVKLGDTFPIHIDFDRPLRLRLQVTNLKPGGDAFGVFGDIRATPS